MKTTSSYKVKIVGQSNIFHKTENIYRKAVAFMIDVVLHEWDTLSNFHFMQEKQGQVEKLTIKNKQRPIVKYDFCGMFYKFPSYLRRAAINDAIGTVSSYMSLHKNWVESGKKGGKPKLNRKPHKMPVFYRDNMFIGSPDDDLVKLKIYHQNDWVWITVKLRHQDVRYIRANWPAANASSPVLVRSGQKCYLRFAFEKMVQLNTTKIEKQTLIAVDLGLNNNAVCCAMRADGTVVSRKFINLNTEKDHLSHTLNKLKKVQQTSGPHNTSRLRKKANRINSDISVKTASAIMAFAESQNADAIVFEHLDFKAKIAGSKKQKLHLWRKREIQEIVTHQAHVSGIRVNHVCAPNTSNLAFDGSGPVKRDKHNFSICVFKTGKTYNCDLSASYNIGARYFINQLCKSIPATVWSQVTAKVPSAVRRTSSTLATLISLNVELQNLLVA